MKVIRAIVLAITVASLIAPNTSARSSGGGGSRSSSGSSSRSSGFSGARNSGTRGTSSTRNWSGRTSNGTYRSSTGVTVKARVWYSPKITAAKPTVSTWGRGTANRTATTHSQTPTQKVALRLVDAPAEHYVVRSTGRYFVLRGSQPVPVYNGEIIGVNDILYVIDLNPAVNCEQSDDEDACGPVPVEESVIQPISIEEMQILNARLRAKRARELKEQKH